MRTSVCILLIFYTMIAGAQTHRIDSLKKLYPGLKGTAQVDCINRIGWEYYYYWTHSDSAFRYTDMAFRRATAIGYKHGQIEALHVRGGVEGRLLGHPDQMEQSTRKAIALLGNDDDPVAASMCFYNLAIALALQGFHGKDLDAADKAMTFALRSNNRHRLGYAEQVRGWIYFKNGELWKCFEPLVSAAEIGREVNDSVLIALPHAILGHAFRLVGDYPKSLSYYHVAMHQAPMFLLLWGHHENMGYDHLVLGNYDSAIYYQKLRWDLLRTLPINDPVRKKFSAFSLEFTVDLQLKNKQYDSVLVRLLPLLKKLREHVDVYPLMEVLLNMAKVYEGKGDYKKAIQYGHELLQWAGRSHDKQFRKEGCYLLYTSFEHLKKADSALHYFRTYALMKDSMETKQFTSRTALYLAASEAEGKIRLLKKDREIREQQLALNKKELQKQAQLKNTLGAGLGVLLLFSFLILRNVLLKRKNELLRNQQQQMGLQRKALELEMQALRAQMNPHFIFNCLSAIDNLIQTRETDKATAYLSRFARLIRSVLDSSKNNVVPFQKDLETLRLYLEMEKFRCNDKFQYALTADPELLQGDYKVPPLIIQPFVENAIHHGLLNKVEGGRQLEISAHLQEEEIVYSVTDNGIGRQQASRLKAINRPDQQSYGIDITRERIHLHNRNGVPKDVEILDLEEDGKPAGTKAVIRLHTCEA